MKFTKLIRKIVSFISIFTIILMFFPITPRQLLKINSLRPARAVTTGQFSNVSVSANNYTAGASATYTVTFTTANALTASDDIIRITFQDFPLYSAYVSAASASLSSLTVGGVPAGQDYTYAYSSYFEFSPDTSVGAGVEVVAVISNVTHRLTNGVERVGIVSFSPSNGGTAYTSCTDAGGGAEQDGGACIPYRVDIPIGTPEITGQLKGPVGSADENKGIANAYIDAWNGAVSWAMAYSDHLGKFYMFGLPSGTYESQIQNPYGVNFAYSAPDKITGISVTSGSTTNLGVIRYYSPSVTGVCKDSSGNAIEGVGVNFMNYAMPNNQTDANGRFYLPHVSAGNYTISFSTWGVTNSSRLVAPDPIPVTISGSGTQDLGVITFDAANKTIRGYVRYVNGSPVTDAVIGCNKPMGGDWLTANVNSSGYYEAIVGRGSWGCMVQHDWSMPQESYDWVYFDMPTPITFKQANSITETATQNFTVTSINSIITGRVLKPDGTVYGGTPINVNVFTTIGYGGWSQVNQSTGEFTVKVPAGTYQVMVNMWDDNWGGPSPRTISVAANTTYNLGNLYLLPKNATIAGTITDANGTAISNQSVDCYVSGEWGKWANGSTDSNGHYSLKVFGEAAYICNPMSNFGGWSGSGDVYLYTGVPRNVDLPNTDSTATDVDFTMTRADATINVTTIDSEGTQLNIFGFSYINQGGVSGGMSGPMMMGPGMGGPINNGSGSFKIPSSMCSVTSPCNLNVSTPPGEGSEWSSAGEVAFSATTNGTANVNVIMMPHNAVISGFLKDREGQAITDTNGNVFANNLESMSFTETRLNTATGGYELTVAAGEYNLGAWVDPNLGYVPCGLSNQKVTALANQTVTQDLTLCAIDAHLEVTVLDPSGNPLPGAFVDASTSSGRREAASTPGMMGPGPMMGPGMMGQMTGSSGTASVGVPAGSGTTFYVSASLPPGMNYINPSKQAVSIASGETKNITLHFRQSDATISGNTTIDGNAVPAFVTGWSESGGFTESLSYNGVYTLNVTKGDNWHINAKTKLGRDFYKSGEKVVGVEQTRESLNLELSLAASNMPDPVTATFNANQPAVVALADGSVTVNVPANSISSTSSDQIKITVSPNYEVPDTDSDKVPTYGVDVTAYKNNIEVENQFNSNLTISQCWSEEQMTEIGLTDSDLSAKYWDEEAGAWKSPGSVSTDDERNCQTSSVNHLTNFALTASELSAPSLTVSSPANNSTVAVNAVTVEGTVSDPSATVTIKLGGTSTGSVSVNSTSGAFSHRVSNLSVGSNTLTVDATNGMGQAATITRAVIYQGSADEESLGVATGVNLDLVLKADNGSSHLQVYDNQGDLKASFFAFGSAFRGQMQVVTADIDGDGHREIIASAGNGLAPHIRVFTYRGVLKGQFYAYASSFRGGVEVTAADVNGDNIADLVTKPKAGGPNIRAYRWDTEISGFTLIDWFQAYQSIYRGELNLSVADVTGNGLNDIIVAPKENGGPNVRVYQYNSTTAKFELVDWFLPYASTFRGGVNLTAGDINGNGLKDIVVAPLSGGGPNVRVYQYNSSTRKFVLLDYVIAYQETYRGGVNLKLLDVDADNDYEIITYPTTASANVRVFTYNTTTSNLELLDWLWVYPSTYRLGYNLSVADVDRDGNREIIVAPKEGGPNVRIYEYNPTTHAFVLADWFMAYAEEFKGGVNLKVADVNGDGYSDLITTPYSAGGPNVRIYKWNNTSSAMTIDKWFIGYTSASRLGVTVNTVF